MATVTEWGAVGGLNETDYAALESFAIDNPKLLGLTIRDGRRAIIARNYVGEIGFYDNNYLEILPKVGTDHNSRRKILVNMLQNLLNVPTEKNSPSGLERTNSSIFEFLIRMFIDELMHVIKIGLNRTYSQYQSNELFLKGKIIHSEDIRYNSATKNRFFVEYEIFDIDCPENRIIKAAINKLIRCSKDNDNIRDLRRYLECFSSISNSSDTKNDFKRCIKSRNTRHYQMIISWCKLFLDNLSVNPFHGENISHVFLFPMEKIYESFVARMLEKKKPFDWSISIQDKSRTLFDDGVKLLPDIVVRNDDKVVILDTKWKVADYEDKITQSDIYQMYIYIL